MFDQINSPFISTTNALNLKAQIEQFGAVLNEPEETNIMPCNTGMNFHQLCQFLLICMYQIAALIGYLKETQDIPQSPMDVTNTQLLVHKLTLVNPLLDHNLHTNRYIHDTLPASDPLNFCLC